MVMIATLGSRLHGDDGWSIGFYGGVLTEAEIEYSLNHLSLIDESYKLTALVLNRDIGEVTKHIRAELEGQIVKQWGNQHHFELNGLLLLRWTAFPWNRTLPTSFAIGEGLSYATEKPEFEKRLKPKVQRLLNFMIWEIAVSLPQWPQWDYFFRVHHRSGVFGLFDGVTGGSNGLTAGMRYSF